MLMIAKKMYMGLLLSALFLFSMGFLAGYILNDSLKEIEEQSQSRAQAKNNASTDKSVDLQGSSDKAKSTGRPKPATRKSRSRKAEEEVEETPEETTVTRGEIMAGLQAAIASGNNDDLDEMLGELAGSSGEPLNEEELLFLEGLLTEENSEHLHALTQALIMAGDERGVEIVMGFLDDSENSLANRREILDSLERLPPERAKEVAPELADFIASDPHRELQSKAARAYGQMHGDEGVESLIGLLEARPDIKPQVLFEAMGSMAGTEELGAMIDLMDNDWSREQKRSLMESIGRASLEDGNPDTLMKLLKEQPPGMSQRLVAEGIERLSHDLDTDFLADALREVPDDPRAQESIARAMARNGGKEGLELLLEAAADPEFELNDRALAHALREASGQGATAAMMDLLANSEREDIVETLARGLSRNADRATMGAMLDLLESSPHPEQRRAIARAIEEGNRNGLPPERLLDLISKENDGDIARNLGRSLERLYPDLVAEQAGSLFENAESAAERVAYARLLSRQRDGAGLSNIAEQLWRETDREAAHEMARMLGRSNDGIRQAREILSNPEVHRDGENRHSILWGIHSGSSSQNQPANDFFLQIAASDRSPHMRSQAAEILARRNNVGALPQLESIISQERDEAARSRMQQSLERLRREAARQN